MPAFQQLLAHGSPVDFDEFDLFLLQAQFDGAGLLFHVGHPDGAGLFGRRGSDHRAENAYEIDGDEVSTADVREWAKVFRFPDARERLMSAGYDGAIYREGEFIEAVAFRLEQIETFGRYPGFEDAVTGDVMIP